MSKKVKVVDVTGADKPLSNAEVFEMIRQVKEISKQTGVLKKKDTEIKAKLNKHFETLKADGKGHRYIEVPDINGNTEMILKREARKSITLDEEKAEKFFKEKGILDKVSHNKVVFDEDVIEGLVVSGELTEDEVLSLANTEVKYYNVFVKNIEEQDDNECH